MDNIDRLIELAIDEDMPFGDITSENLVPKSHTSTARIRAKEVLILCGLSVAERVFKKLDPDLNISILSKDGEVIQTGTEIMNITGSTVSILKGERIALNFLQRLSGISTNVSKYVEKLKGTEVKVWDTRKTTPGFRILEKMAVKFGGGSNHRISLSDAVMIKDNHIDAQGSMEKAFREIKSKIDSNKRIEIETRTLIEVKEAVALNPDIIMLDNMCVEIIKKAVHLIRANEKKKILIEVSGGITLETIRDYALPVTTIANYALTTLFTDNVFRAVPADIEKSCFYNKDFTLLVCPFNKLDSSKYEGKLRMNKDLGATSNMAIAMDFDRRIGVVYGSAYNGSCKKLLFTAMNYMLPAEGILPLHCSANEGKAGDTALMLGLSGTGKTSLSSDPARALLGDDEHGWNDKGIANFENGCYAKLIDLDPKKETEIYNAVMVERKPNEHGAIVENAMMYPQGHFDLYDARLTQNSRVSYPLTFLSNIKESSVGDHPKAILFLTADANGVLPPVSKLNKKQAMLWFLMGYTSKLAGTETGITEPVSTFSRFFGAPFMPRNPDVYAKMLGEKLDKYTTNAYLINTGWSGGPYGVGKRIDISLTRAMVHAAISGELENAPTTTDKLFHLEVPENCPGINDASILTPKNTWTDKAAYDERAKKLASDFSSYFDKAYGSKGIDADVAKECPGK